MIVPPRGTEGPAGRAIPPLQDGMSIYRVTELLGDIVGMIERVCGDFSVEDLAPALDGRRF
jgi:hypothetical protein